MAALDVLSRRELDAALARLPGWRFRLGGLATVLKCPTSAIALKLFARIGELAEEADHHPDVDWRYDTLYVALSSHDAGGTVTGRDAALAVSIADAGKTLGAMELPGRLRSLEICMDTEDIEAVAPMWAAAMGYVAGAPDEVRDPAGRLPTLWFQKTGTPNPNRFHFDIHVPASETADLLAKLERAGARLDRSSAPAFVIATDVQGNRLCVCSEEGREI